MPKYFTLTEAEALLPAVEPAIREAIALKAAYEEAERNLEQAVRRVAVVGGALVDREQILYQKSRRQESAAKLKQILDTIHGYGCLVKDLDMGLIDFPTLYLGNQVLLCWKLGETGIGFWHGMQEGFRGRKKIDSEFLNHHQGDVLH